MLTEIRGSAADRSESYARRSAAEQRFYAKCMDAAGFIYEIPPTPVEEPPMDSYVASWWDEPDVNFAKKVGFGYVRPITVALEFTSDSYEALTEKGKNVYNVSLDSCIDTAMSSGEYDGPINAEATELESALLGALTKETLESRFSMIRQEYAACVKGQGFSFESPYDAGDAVETELGQLGYYNMDPRSKEHAETFPRAQDADRRVAVVDAVCRRQSAGEVAKLLSPVLQSWSDTNAVAISDLPAS